MGYPRAQAAPPGHLDYDDAAPYLGICRRQLELLVAQGAIAVYRPLRRVVFFPIAELDRYKAEKTQREGEQPRRKRRVR